MPRLGIKKRAEMVDLYLNGVASPAVAKQYGVTYAAVRKAVLASGNAMRSNSEVKKKYRYDETFFSVIDAEDKAYWLGFISADGTVIENKGLAVALKSSDLPHLQKLQTSLNSTHPVKDRGNYCQFVIASQNLAKQLTNLGVTPRKSLTLKPCLLIPDELLRHYWRGLIDGDGCLSKSLQKSRGKDKYCISLTGSVSVVNAFQQIGSSLTGCNPKVNQRGNAFSVCFGGNRSFRTLTNFLYKNANVYLERKHAIYLHMSR